MIATETYWLFGWVGGSKGQPAPTSDSTPLLLLLRPHSNSEVVRKPRQCIQRM